MAKILVVHGPNLNLLGTREPAYYGTASLSDIDERLMKLADDHGHRLTCVQSNAEHQLVDAIQAAGADGVAYIIINPAAFTHTSVALRDALAAVDIPFVEVHLSNIHAREAFRSRSYFSDAAVGVVSGFGPMSYELACRAVLRNLEQT